MLGVLWTLSLLCFVYWASKINLLKWELPYSTNEDRYLACGSKNTKIPVFSNKVDGDAEKILIDVTYILKLFAFQVP